MDAIDWDIAAGIVVWIALVVAFVAVLWALRKRPKGKPPGDDWGGEP